MRKIMIAVAVAFTLVGCNGTSPLLNANSNKTEVLSLSRFINITTINYTDSFSGNKGTTTQVKD